jgi:hypothetical protein
LGGSMPSLRQTASLPPVNQSRGHNSSSKSLVGRQKPSSSSLGSGGGGGGGSSRRNLLAGGESSRASSRLAGVASSRSSSRARGNDDESRGGGGNGDGGPRAQASITRRGKLALSEPTYTAEEIEIMQLKQDLERMSKTDMSKDERRQLYQRIQEAEQRRGCVQAS